MFCNITEEGSRCRIWNCLLVRLERLLEMARIHELKRGRMNNDRLDAFVVCQGRHIEFPKFDAKDPSICELQIKLLKTFHKTMTYSLMLDHIRESAIYGWLDFLNCLIRLEEPEKDDHLGQRRRVCALKVLVSLALSYEVMIHRPASKLYGRKMLVRMIFRHDHVKTVLNYGLTGEYISPKALQLIFVYCRCYTHGMAVEYPDIIEDMFEFIRRQLTLTVGYARSSANLFYPNLDRISPQPECSGIWHDCESDDTMLNSPNQPLWALIDLIDSLHELTGTQQASSILFESMLEALDDEQKVGDALVAITLLYFVTSANGSCLYFSKYTNTILKCLTSDDVGSKGAACWILANFSVYLKDARINIVETTCLDLIRTELIRCCLDESIESSPLLRDAARGILGLARLDENRFKLDEDTVSRVLPRLISTERQVTEVFLDYMHTYPDVVKRLSASIFEDLLVCYKNSYKTDSNDSWRLRLIIMGILMKIINDQGTYGPRSEVDEEAVLETWIDFNEDPRNDPAGLACEARRPEIFLSSQQHNFLLSRKNPNDIDRLFASITGALSRGLNEKVVMQSVSSILHHFDVDKVATLRLLEIYINYQYASKHMIYDCLMSRITSELCRADHPALISALRKIRELDSEAFDKRKDELEDRSRHLLDKLFPSA